MSDMFCYQCQQTAGNKGCVKVGVCGKQPDTARLQDELVIALIRLAEAVQEKGVRTRETDRLLIDGLFTTLTNVNFDNQAIQGVIDRAVEERKKLEMKEIPVVDLFVGETDLVSLRSTLLFGMRVWRRMPIMRTGWDREMRRSTNGFTKAYVKSTGKIPSMSGWS